MKISTVGYSTKQGGKEHFPKQTVLTCFCCHNGSMYFRVRPVLCDRYEF